MGGNTCDCVDVHLQTVNMKDEQKVMVKLRSMEYRNKINKKGAMGNKMYIILCRTVLCLSEAEEGVVSWWGILGAVGYFGVSSSIGEQGRDVPATVFMVHHRNGPFPFYSCLMVFLLSWAEFASGWSGLSTASHYPCPYYSCA